MVVFEIPHVEFVDLVQRVVFLDDGTYTVRVFAEECVRIYQSPHEPVGVQGEVEQLRVGLGQQ